MEPVPMSIGSKEKISPCINKSQWVVQSFASLLMLDAIKCSKSVIGDYRQELTGYSTKTNAMVVTVQVLFDGWVPLRLPTRTLNFIGRF
jgi:hypothetical protein